MAQKFFNTFVVMLVLPFFALIFYKIYEFVQAKSIVPQSLDFDVESEQILTTMRFDTAVDICVVGAYTSCADNLCYHHVPEGTMGLIVSELDSKKETVFLFINTIREIGENYALTLFYLSHGSCITKQAHEPLTFETEAFWINGSSLHNEYRVWLK